MRWVRADGAQGLQTGIAGSVAEFAEAEGGNLAGDLIVILPGERFAARQITTPAKNRQQILQSAKFLLEDDLAGPVDDLHLAIAGGTEDARKTVVAVDEAYIVDWIAALKEHGLTPQIMSVDFLCLAGLATDDEPVALIENNRLLYLDNGNGFVSERSFSGEIISTLLADTEKLLLAFTLEGDQPLETSGSAQTDHVLKNGADLVRLYLQAIEKALPVNLLQGKLKPSYDWRSSLGPWRTAGMLAAACFVLFLGFQLADGFRLNNAARGIEQAAEEKFRQAYPDTTIRNLRASARRLARGGSAGESYFLDLSSALTRTLEEGGAVQLLTITYEPSGQLVAEIRGATFEDIDALEQRLTSKGIAVSQGRNATQDDSGYTAKIFLEAGA